MKKHLSILMLAARFTVYKVIGLMLTMSGVQTALFVLNMKRDESALLEEVFGSSRLWVVALLAFAVLCVLLSGSGNGSGGSKSIYTLRRLSVNEPVITGWWTGYNCLIYLVFWLWEALTVIGLGLIYLRCMPEAMVGPQTILLACYRNWYLQNLIPLADVSCWIRNVILVICLGICSACCAFHERRGGKGIAIWFMAITTIVSVSGAIARSFEDVMVIVWSLIITAIAVGAAVDKMRHPEEDKD